MIAYYGQITALSKPASRIHEADAYNTSGDQSSLDRIVKSFERAPPGDARSQAIKEVASYAEKRLSAVHVEEKKKEAILAKAMVGMASPAGVVHAERSILPIMPFSPIGRRPGISAPRPRPAAGAVGGAAGGAGVGFLFGGPIGALVGALAGGLIGRGRPHGATPEAPLVATPVMMMPEAPIGVGGGGGGGTSMEQLMTSAM